MQLYVSFLRTATKLHMSSPRLCVACVVVLMLTLVKEYAGKVTRQTRSNNARNPASCRGREELVFKRKLISVRVLPLQFLTQFQNPICTQELSWPYTTTVTTSARSWLCRLFW